MFYYAAKFFWFFATPSNLLLFLVLGGALLNWTRWRRFGSRLALTSAIVLLTLGLTPLPHMMLAPLEARFPPFADDGLPVDGVIVLGGSFETEPTVKHGQAALNEAGERVLAIATLARLYPAARIIYSGGGSGFAADTTPEATLVERTVAALGVDPARIEYERQSLNTWENAVYSKALAKPKSGERWLLVTSAFHMPRAVGAFRKVGFAVTAYPVDFRVAWPQDATRFFAFSSEGLRRTDLAVKEWVGLFAYYATGRSDELLP